LIETACFTLGRARSERNHRQSQLASVGKFVVSIRHQGGLAVSTSPDKVGRSFPSGHSPRYHSAFAGTLRISARQIGMHSKECVSAAKRVEAHIARSDGGEFTSSLPAHINGLRFTRGTGAVGYWDRLPVERRPEGRPLPVHLADAQSPQLRPLAATERIESAVDQVAG